MLRHLEAERISPRTAASLIEIDRSLSTWPQVASEVILGASSVAEAVRRIGLGEAQGSGRCRIDVGWALSHLDQPEITVYRAALEGESSGAPVLRQFPTPLSLPLCAHRLAATCSHGSSMRIR